MADGDPSTSRKRRGAPFGSWLPAEVHTGLPAEDDALVQLTVAALRHPSLQANMRRCIKEAFSEGGLLGFKAFLLLAPFEEGDLDVERGKEPDRDLEW